MDITLLRNTEKDIGKLLQNNALKSAIQCVYTVNNFNVNLYKTVHLSNI